MSDNKSLQKLIDTGPGWTPDQQKKREKVNTQVEEEKDKREKNKIALEVVKLKILEAETNIFDVEITHDKNLTAINQTDKRIELLQSDIIAENQKKLDFEQEIESLHLCIQQAKEQTDIENKVLLRNKQELRVEKDGLKESQEEINEHAKNYKKEEIQKLTNSDNLIAQNITNEQIENEIATKRELVQEKKIEIERIVKNITENVEQMDIISGKINEAEQLKRKSERERDNLKLKMFKMNNVDMKMVMKESDNYKRQIDYLKQEIDVMDRKWDLSENSSSVALELIKGSERVLKNLQHELDNLARSNKNSNEQREDLNLKQTKMNETIEETTKKCKKAHNILQEQDEEVENMKSLLSSAEQKLKQKQSMCESMKVECNHQCKILGENQHEIINITKKFNVLSIQIKQEKMEISKTENALINEHFHHHDSDKDREILQREIDKLHKQTNEIEHIQINNNEEIQKLCNLIKIANHECTKGEKDYNSIMSERDIIGSKFLQKNLDLEKICKTIKIQQSDLHHGEVQYQELIVQIRDLSSKLQKLNKEKNDVVEQVCRYNKLLVKCTTYDSQLRQARTKNGTLREELQRPMNVHRWRILEHRDPACYEKIQKIQKVQKQIIETFDAISKNEKHIDEKERLYFELKNERSNQPEVGEIKKYLKIYTKNVEEKEGQMKEMELELELQKRKMIELKESIVKLDSEKLKLHLKVAQSPEYL